MEVFTVQVFNGFYVTRRLRRRTWTERGVKASMGGRKDGGRREGGGNVDAPEQGHSKGKRLCLLVPSFLYLRHRRFFPSIDARLLPWYVFQRRVVSFASLPTLCQPTLCQQPFDTFVCGPTDRHRWCMRHDTVLEAATKRRHPLLRVDTFHRIEKSFVIWGFHPRPRCPAHTARGRLGRRLLRRRAPRV